MGNNKNLPIRPEREPTRTGMSVKTLQRAFLDNLFYLLGRFREVASPHDHYMAAAFTVRDRMLERWIKTAETYKETGARTVCYLSAEFLIGPQLRQNLINLGIFDAAAEAAHGLGLDYEAILQQEEEPGLGSGGLGRLAACYLDSLATLQIPAIGYGIRYEFGIFDQEIRDGWQVEVSDRWLRNGNPWELARPELRFPVRFGGYTEARRGEDGRLHVHWEPGLVINGTAFDTPVPGYGVANANLLRLWKSEAYEGFDFQAFNLGDYYGAVDAEVVAENLTKVLYPNDEPEVGKELRLKQQYFFVSCTLQDMIRLHLQQSDTLDGLQRKFVAQLNDTHPAIAVPELMRLLVDEHDLDWEPAWEVCRQTFAYTNHTLLPEALETWSLDLFERVLPRHLELIYEINRRFLDQVRVRFPWDQERVARMSLIAEDGRRSVRMANLACVGSFAVNGVAELHSELLKSTVLADFYDLWPDKFHNVTNGVTPRRFMQMANPDLCRLLSGLVGPDWPKDLERLRVLEARADDPGLQQDFQAVKRSAKVRLAGLLRDGTVTAVDPDSLFDIQVKRIHEYKRQHLNLLHVLTLYQRLKQTPGLDLVPRTFVFAGKAAPGYRMAKLIIKLINSVAEVIERDPQVNGSLRVLFYPDFNVKRAEPIYPAADLSEQISTAGMEASGTGNMKFAMNGALTIGTLDGANVEIRQAVGAENFFRFGLDAEQAMRVKAEGYRPAAVLDADPELRSVLDLIDSGLFSHGDRDLFRPLTRDLREQDLYLLCADYRSYVECQASVDRAYRDPSRWNRMALLNLARMGRFSSDRAIREYCDKIWHVAPVPVELGD